MAALVVINAAVPPALGGDAAAVSAWARRLCEPPLGLAAPTSGTDGPEMA